MSNIGLVGCGMKVKWRKDMQLDKHFNGGIQDKNTLANTDLKSMLGCGTKHMLRRLCGELQL